MKQNIFILCNIFLYSCKFCAQRFIADSFVRDGPGLFFPPLTEEGQGTTCYCLSVSFFLFSQVDAIYIFVSALFPCRYHSSFPTSAPYVSALFIKFVLLRVGLIFFFSCTYYCITREFYLFYFLPISALFILLVGLILSFCLSHHFISRGFYFIHLLLGIFLPFQDPHHMCRPYLFLIILRVGLNLLFLLWGSSVSPTLFSSPC